MMKWFVVMLLVIWGFGSKCLICFISHVKPADLIFQHLDPSHCLKTILWYLVYLVQIRNDMIETSRFGLQARHRKSTNPVLQYLPERVFLWPPRPIATTQIMIVCIDDRKLSIKGWNRVAFNFWERKMATGWCKVVINLWRVWPMWCYAGAMSWGEQCVEWNGNTPFCHN